MAYKIGSKLSIGAAFSLYMGKIEGKENRVKCDYNGFSRAIEDILAFCISQRKKLVLDLRDEVKCL